MRILVFGAGSLGSLLGGLLATTHDVTLLGRDAHVRAIEAGGLSIEGEIERTVSPAAVTDLTAGTAFDLALLTVKAYDTRTAARALGECDPGVALSLQNGMGNEEILEERLETDVLAGMTTFGARRPEPGVVRCTGTGSVTLGPHGDTPRAVATRVGRAFEDAGIATTVVADPEPHLWEKMAVNAGINPTTALTGVRNGALADGPAAGIAEAAALETAAVAREQGVDLGDERALEAVRSVAAATARNRSSMLQDVTEGRRTEIDAINGYVCEQAREAVPVNETLAALVRAWEAGERLR